MKALTAREFNQDVSLAKRLATAEPVLVTDRGRPTHVLIGIEAWRKLSGEERSAADLLAAAPGALPFDPADIAAALPPRR